MNWKSTIFGDSYGLWQKEALGRATETYMDHADNETLKDGIRFYRAQNQIMAFLMLAYVLGVAFGCMLILSDMGSLHQRQLADVKEQIGTLATRLCGGGQPVWQTSTHNDVVVFCADNRTIVASHP